MQGRQVDAALDGSTVLSVQVPRKHVRPGFAAVGTETFARAQFDNFSIRDPTTADMKFVEKNRDNWTDKLRGLKNNHRENVMHFTSVKYHIVSEKRPPEDYETEMALVGKRN